ncbi:MAG: flagellar hook assembly protein FlgD [Deltaproteobacteria bacterium]|nr:flagellar hook assembly protein FlgD [Deltaproteobacteria bacterium]
MAGEINNVGSTSASSGLTSALGGGSSALGQDAFLKLLVAQISHQDPLKPMDDTAFVAQLAQFSSLEQAISTNAKLDFLALQQRGVANTEMAVLVGKNVTVKGDKVRLDGQNLAVPVNFTLDGDATTVAVTIKDAQGKTVRTMQLGQQQAGLVKINWDGKDDNGMTLPTGTYSVSIEAKADGGAPVGYTQECSGVLKSVSFANGYPLLELDTGVTAPASDLLKVNDQGKVP